MTKKLIVGNWKMNPGTLDEAKRIAQKTRRAALELANVSVVICPPAVFIAPCSPKAASSGSAMGAQDVSFDEGGPHTGEYSAVMLRDLGVEYVIIGHSERRAAGESDETVAKKIRAVLSADLTPIVCVGEKARDEAGTHYAFLKEQIRNSFADVPKKSARDIVIAYEPVWAIGGKEAMLPEQLLEMSIFVKKVFADIFGPELAMKLKVLYGGAVTFRNAADIIRIGKVDGLLVGRESVNIAGFVELLKAVEVI